MSDKVSLEEVKRYYDDVYWGGHHPVDKAVSRDGRLFYGTLLDYLDVSAGGRILDVSCGIGTLLKLAEESMLVAIGLDLSTAAVAVAARRLREGSVILGRAEDLPFVNGAFDYITCVGSLEHYLDAEKALREFLRVSSPKCRKLISVPNSNYLLHMIGYRTDTQIVRAERSAREWERLLTTSGLKVTRSIKSNSHLDPRFSSSSPLKHFVKIILSPLRLLLPKRLSYELIFICLKR